MQQVISWNQKTAVHNQNRLHELLSAHYTSAESEKVNTCMKQQRDKTWKQIYLIKQLNVRSQLYWKYNGWLDMNLRVPIKARHPMNSWKSNDCSNSLYHGVNQTLYYEGDGHGQIWGTIMEFAWMAGGKPQKTSGSTARTWVDICSPTSQTWSKSITHSISTFYLCFVHKLCNAQENMKYYSSVHLLKTRHTHICTVIFHR